jgi:DNA segregation ATPase FtsK/SpoIIIE-like protein
MTITVKDPERYRFAADSLHGVATVAVLCANCSEGEEGSPVHVFDFLFPSLADVRAVIAQHETAAHPDDAALLRHAVALVAETRMGSPSMLCRRLRQDHGIVVTFGGALALLNRMEDAGIVGPAEGSKARPVLLDQRAALAALEVS